MRALLAVAVLCALATARAESLSASRSGVASCYGREHHQVRTATGQNYDPSRLTAAHRSWPFGTRVLVCNPSRRASAVAGAAASARRCITVTINDRGPAAWTHRAIDLSLGACRAIGNRGLARVFLQIVGGPHEPRSRDRSRRHARRGS